MTETHKRHLAVPLWGLTIAGVGTGVLIWLLANGPVVDDEVPTKIVVLLAILTYSTVGFVLARRMPQHRMGWMFLAAGLLGAVWVVSIYYGNAALLNGWDGAWLATWLHRTVYFPWILSMVALPVLLFPDGHLPSPRWRWLGRFIAFSFVVNSVLPAFKPQYEEELAEGVFVVSNPLGLEAVSPMFDSPAGLLGFVAVLMLSLLGPAAALIWRFRRSQGVERLQLKWFVFAAAVAGTGLLTFYLAENLSAQMRTWMEVFALPLVLLAVLGIPVATGLAIVRFRLYDIDRLISRTISYGILVGVLAGIFAGGVFLLGGLLPLEGNMPTAVSTLAVAGLFNPLRRRMQTTIDRRFYRSSYDARQVVDRFSDRLRDQVDIDILTTELLQAAEQTMKPANAAIWLRPPRETSLPRPEPPRAQRPGRR